MIWKETGVLKGSCMCFFNNSDTFTGYYDYMVSCGYFLCDKEYHVQRPGSCHPLFFYILDGTLDFEYEGQTYQGRTDDIILLNGNHPHHYFCRDHCEFLFFHFNGNNVIPLIDHLNRKNGSPLHRLKNAREIRQHISGPIMKLCYEEQASEVELSNLVYSTLCMIPPVRSDSTLFIPSQVKVTEEMTSYRVIEHINKNIGLSFTVQELADLAGLSRQYFIRLFKKETGYTPQEYVSTAKINYAKMMLTTTALSVTEIAEFLGYSSPASFINAFRSRRGISPNRYRALKNRTE